MKYKVSDSENKAKGDLKKQKTTKKLKEYFCVTSKGYRFHNPAKI